MKKIKLLLENEFPEPVISVAVEPKTKEDQEKMGIALGRLAQEDPSFRLRTDEESGQTIISGMGELHLDVLVDSMRREFNVELIWANLKWLIEKQSKKEVEQESKLSGSQAVESVWTCLHRIEPLVPDEDSDENYKFINEIVGGAIPREFIPAVE